MKTQILTLVLGIACYVGAQTIDIDTRKALFPVQPTMYGIFFEDINYGADGGLYAEMVKNRSFEFPQTLMGWNTMGGVSVREDGPFERCPHYLRLSYSGHDRKPTLIENIGTFGMGFREGEQYRFSIWARTANGNAATLRVQLCDANDRTGKHTFTEERIEVRGQEWKKYTLVLTAAKTTAEGTLRVELIGKNAADVEHVSLFPVDTWMGHENGMRKDLAQALYDLHPGVFRFPGGCVVEGADLDSRYQWKNTLGPVENRPLNDSRWRFDMSDRLSPDYHQTCGLGFYEYFLLAEELGAEPLPVVNCGMACEFDNDYTQPGEWLVPMDKLQPYIDDALDLIEFANGNPATSKWAAIRAEMGHPAPFNMKYLGIGNEQFGQYFPERLEAFMTQIRAAHPEIQIIGSAGPWPDGKEYDEMWTEMRRLKPELVDEHYYKPDEWFLAHADRYDSYSRKGPKVFAGEYCCHTNGNKTNHFGASLCEAAFMTGLERNADIVTMATYAPLFAHVRGWQWQPDMIWFDNLRSVRTCSYYVQQMHSQTRGTHVLRTTMDGRPVVGKEGQHGLYASAVQDADKDQLIVKLVNTSAEPQTVTLRMKKLAGERRALMTVLRSDEDNVENTLDNPQAVVPQQQTISITLPEAVLTLPARSFVMLMFDKQ